MEEKHYIQQGHTAQVQWELSESYENNKIMLSRERLVIAPVAFQVKIIVLKSPNTEGTLGYYDFVVLIAMRLRKIFQSDNLTYIATISSKISNLIKPKAKWVISKSTTWSQIREHKETRATSLHFSFDITVELDCQSNPSPLAHLHNDIMDLTDFELCGKDGSVHVHKVIIAAYSPVLQKLVTGDWREAKEGRVKVKGTTTETLQHLKDYMYNDKLPENGLKQLMVLASYYLMEDLEQKCSFKLLKNLSVENGLELAEFAAKNGMRYLFLAIIKTAQNGGNNYVKQMEKFSLVQKSVDDENSDEEDN